MYAHLCVYLKRFLDEINKIIIMNNLKLSGALYFLAGSLALMGITTAEFLRPSGYLMSKNEM